VIENIIFALYITLELKYSLILVSIVAVVISNIIAIAIAYPTEMHYKDLANFLNGFMNKITYKSNYTLKDSEVDKRRYT
jgi:hypothetical protein